PVTEESRVHLLRGVEGPHARPDLRAGAVRRARHGVSRGVAHINRVAAFRLSGNALDGAGENPGMATAQRSLAAALQVNHFLRARGCAASYTLDSAWKSRCV